MAGNAVIGSLRVNLGMDSAEFQNGAKRAQSTLGTLGAGIKAFALFLRLPKAIVMATVVVLSVLGSYALRSSTVDIYVMLASGVLGYVMEGAGIPLTPMVLGLILGPMVEDNLRVGLIKTGGSLVPFLTRPICAGLIVCMLAALFGESLVLGTKRLIKRWRGSSVSE